MSAVENRLRDQHHPFATSPREHLEGDEGMRYRWFLPELQIVLSQSYAIVIKRSKCWLYVGQQLEFGGFTGGVLEVVI